MINPGILASQTFLARGANVTVMAEKQRFNFHNKPQLGCQSNSLTLIRWFMLSMCNY